MNRPHVGVKVFLFKDEKILIGKRKNSFGEGLYSLPGGHLEGGEEFLDACKREVLEETGIKIDEIGEFCSINDIQEGDDKHYVILYFIAQWKQGQEPKNMEPEKCEGWEWHDAFNLPEPLYPALKKVIDAYCIQRDDCEGHKI